jgi:hypothetical protein
MRWSLLRELPGAVVKVPVRRGLAAPEGVKLTLRRRRPSWPQPPTRPAAPAGAADGAGWNLPIAQKVTHRFGGVGRVWAHPGLLETMMTSGQYPGSLGVNAPAARGAVAF